MSARYEACHARLKLNENRTLMCRFSEGHGGDHEAVAADGSIVQRWEPKDGAR